MRILAYICFPNPSSVTLLLGRTITQDVLGSISIFHIFQITLTFSYRSNLFISYNACGTRTHQVCADVCNTQENLRPIHLSLYRSNYSDFFDGSKLVFHLSVLFHTTANVSGWSTFSPTSNIRPYYEKSFCE